NRLLIPFPTRRSSDLIEMDFANLTCDRHNPDRTDVRKTAYEVAPMNLKIGLLNNLDGQLTLSPYRWERTEDIRTGTLERRSGFGDRKSTRLNSSHQII